MSEGKEKRKEKRVDLESRAVRGKLYNVVQFRVKDLSWSGINIHSSFQAEVGRTYHIHLFQDGRQQDFEIEVLRAQVDSILARPTEIFASGLLYAIAARFVRMNAERSSFLRHFLERRDTGSEVGVFPDAEPVDRKP